MSRITEIKLRYRVEVGDKEEESLDGFQPIMSWNFHEQFDTLESAVDEALKVARDTEHVRVVDTEATE